MPQTNIGSSERSSTSGFVDYSVPSEVLDGVEQTEFEWTNSFWN